MFRIGQLERIFDWWCVWSWGENLRWHCLDLQRRNIFPEKEKGFTDWRFQIGILGIDWDGLVDMTLRLVRLSYLTTCFIYSQRGLISSGAQYTFSSLFVKSSLDDDYFVGNLHSMTINLLEILTWWRLFSSTLWLIGSSLRIWCLELTVKNRLVKKPIKSTLIHFPTLADFLGLYRP